MKKTVLFFFFIFFSQTTALFSQGAGDAAVFQAGQYYVVQLPLDSNSQCTMECWVKPVSIDTKAELVFFGESENSGFGLIAQTVAGTFGSYASICLGGKILSATGNYTRLPLNIWTHLALTLNNKIWRLYRNGALVGTGKNDHIAASRRVSIGKDFNGSIDEVKLWGKALTQAEIQSSLTQTLTGNESNLMAYYSMDSKARKGDTLLMNVVVNSDSTTNATSQSVGKPIFFESDPISLFPVPSPLHIFTDIPSHQQFFPRNRSNFANVHFTGSINEPGYDSITVRKYTNDNLISSWSHSLKYNNSSAPFSFIDSIHAEMSEFTYTIFLQKGKEQHFLGESADLIAGDAFFINGQSNAHPAISWYANTNQFIRTFGVQTSNQNFDPYDPGDTSWGYGNVHGWGEFFTGPYLIGVWPQRMGDYILQNYGIPVCFINGAAGGSKIEEHLPSDSDRLDLASIYGKALYRSLKSGLQKSYKALFWYQGEYNSINGYYDNFLKLYRSWFIDYSDSLNIDVLSKIYLFQIHPGCVPGERSALRELQRTLPDSLPKIEVMSTCGTTGHDGCHFDAFGYWHIAENIFRYVAHDFYGSSDTIDIHPPNIIKAWYGDSVKDIVILKFRNTQGLIITADTLISGITRSLKDYFYLDSMQGAVQSVHSQGDSVVLKLTVPSQAKFISYLPDETYNNDDTLIYEGPWILNKRGVGAFSFYNVPLDPYIPDTTTSNTGNDQVSQFALRCFPNPVLKSLSVAYRMPQNIKVQFDLIDISGNVILPLGNQNAVPGENIATFNLAKLPSGEYFLQIKIGADIFTRKIIML